MEQITTQILMPHNGTTRGLKDWLCEQVGAAAPRSEPAALLSTFEKVQRAKREWESAADVLSDLICVLDEEGRILRANRVLEGWNLGDVTTVNGLDFHTLLHPICKDAACPLHVLVQEAAGKDTGDPVEIETFDESLGRYILAKAFPVRDRDKAPQSTMVVVIRDVSDRKRCELEAINDIDQAILAAQSSEEMIRAALDRIRCLVPYKWASITLLDANGPEAISLASDASGMDCSTARRGFTATFSVPIIARGECIGSLDLALGATPASTPIHQGILYQIAARLGLAIRQARLYEKLQQSHAELEEALRVREEMIQNVSHELRTPLAIIKGYASILAERELGPLTGDQSEALDIMLAQGNRLQHMVDQLLMLQMLESSPLDLSECDPGSFLHGITRNWLPRMQSRGITLQVEAPEGLPNFICDQELLRTVIDNLLENALKFSCRDTTVTLSAARHGAELWLAVADQGCGIPASKLGRIFERFYQVDGKMTRSVGGMGIGLAICKKAVELQAGRIWAESGGEGRGSTFVVALRDRSAPVEAGSVR